MPNDYEVDVPNSLGEADGASSVVRLRFRTVDVPGQLPLAASDLAFGSLHHDSETDEQQRALRDEAVQDFIATPFPLRRTVAAAYVPVEEDPPQLESESLSKGLNSAIRGLNAWLISVGVLYEDRLRPISIGDLAPAIPFMPARLVDQGFEHGPSELLSLHSYPEEIRSYDETEMDQVERMLSIVGSEEGLSSFYELVQRAGSARRASRDREAVIDYGTAGELFITTMLLAVGQRQEIDGSRLSNLLDGPFHDRAVHLCRLLNVSSDPDSPESPLFYWWLHCYRQRNQIVHRGAGSMGALSEAARIGLVQMVVDVREAIRKDPELSDLASMIRWGRRVDHTGSGADSEPDPLPPVD